MTSWISWKLPVPLAQKQPPSRNITERTLSFSIVKVFIFIPWILPSALLFVGFEKSRPEKQTWISATAITNSCSFNARAYYLFDARNFWIQRYMNKNMGSFLSAFPNLIFPNLLNLGIFHDCYYKGVRRVRIPSTHAIHHYQLSISVSPRNIICFET